jgi:hypothetical protein
VERVKRWGLLLDRKGKFVSTTDLIIASAAYKKARLANVDSDFELVSTEVDLEEERIKRVQLLPLNLSLPLVAF